MRTERRILSGTEENPITVVETRWEDDGSRVESFQDYRTGAANFTVYNAQGEMVESVHGNFDTPKKPEPSAQTQSEWQLPRRDAQEPTQPAAQMPTWQYSQEPPRQQSQIPTQPTAPAWLPEKKAPLEFSRPLAAAAAALLSFTMFIGSFGSLLQILNSIRFRNTDFALDYLMSILPSLCLNTLLLVVLVRFRKDWLMGTYFALSALLGTVSLVTQFPLLSDYPIFWIISFLGTALNAVMAADCFRELRMPVGVKRLLFGGGKTLLILASTANSIFFYPSLSSNSVLISCIFTLIGNTPIILLGFALAGAKPMGDRERRGYVSMGVHVVLALFVSRIWSLVWVYRTSRLLRRDAGELSPVAQLLLFLFIPFYSIAWYYNYAKRVNERAVSMGLPADNSFGTVCLLCGIFLPVVSLILIQNKVNRLAAIPEPGYGACAVF